MKRSCPITSFLSLPRIACGTKMGAASFVQFRGILQHPAVDSAVVYTESSLSHPLFQIPIAQGVAAVPTHVEQDEVVLKMLPFKRRSMGHGWEMGAGTLTST